MVDRISTLPDEILHHVLSFLPTQTAVATSTLSKRWKPLWRSVPTLHFDDQTYLQTSNKKFYHCFRNFIYKTILATDSHQPIITFRLKCVDHSDFYLSDTDLDASVKAAVQRGVQNLHINVPITTDWTPLSLNSSTVCCKTLVVLNLTGLYFDVFSSIELPSLKTLDLKNVGFVEQECLVELLSGCPILEDMNLRSIFSGDDSAPSYKNFKGLSKLVKAELYDLDLKIHLNAICNVEFLCIDEYHEGGIPVFPNLTHLELMLGTGMNWNLVHAMLNKCPKLRIFGLDMQISYTDVVWISPCVVPECLSSQLRKCSITNYGGTESELHFAKYIMQNSSVLRKMVICTAPSSKLEDKFEMIKELSLFPRTCELLFQ